ncbi:hypothetical protein [Aquibacillus salsiterrae]|uniref:Uncharacterized protein n=1 Tax=Aquibacillus salsiterrae TaxID=2950439 RepID=A0A9X3WC12_9BACI|nr:hypothetical protein [Aquibacillus salsiterrae]MDC3416972.1 hypothetical protein [Aquibacillus salsiterrae]
MNQNNNAIQQIILTVSVLLLVAIGIFYWVMIRPVVAEEKQKETELKQVETAVADYQKLLADLTPQQLTDEEKDTLLKGIPVRPNVEQVIVDLEKTEKNTGVLINSISFGNLPVGKGKVGQVTEAAEEEKELSTAEWNAVFPEPIFKLIEAKFKDVKVKVNYLDVQLSVNGKEAEINRFIEGLENLPRVVHVQSYSYSGGEKGADMSASISARVFYSDSFAPFVAAGNDYELGELASEPEPNREPELVVDPEPDTPDAGEVKEPDEEQAVKRYETEIVMDGSSIRVTTDTPPVEGEGQGFYFVQTGAYTNDYYLLNQVDYIKSRGLDPRVSDSSISLIFSSVSYDIPSAAKKAIKINEFGIDTYIMPLKINLTEEEKEWLLPVAQDTLEAVAKVTTKGIAANDLKLTEQQFNQVVTTMNNYEDAVIQSISNMADDNQRKVQLNNTIAILNQVESVLASHQKEPSVAKLWDVDGLLIDFTLNLNGNMLSNE